MDKFKHVVGVIHTNYLSYTRTHTLGQIKEPLVYYINQGTIVRYHGEQGNACALRTNAHGNVQTHIVQTGVCRAYCHKIIKLSGALQEFAAEKEIVCNVHGAGAAFSKFFRVNAGINCCCMVVQVCDPSTWLLGTEQRLNYSQKVTLYHVIVFYSLLML